MGWRADTSTEAARVQLEVLRRMTGAERVAIALDLSETARALSEAGIRHRHPEWTDETVRDALMDLLLGPQLARDVRRARIVPP
jgi:hypothetical protein